jgi:Carboxypeptidase regulatory-like domain
MRSLCRRLLLLPAALAVIAATVSPAAADEATGSLSVHVTTSTGAPARFAFLLLHSSDGVGHAEQFTEPDGTYRFDDLNPGDYKLSLEYGGVKQYAHQKLDLDSADTFTVRAGEDTEVDEQMLAPGSIDVKVVDARDGAPVDTACVSVAFQGSENCSPDGGVYHFTELGQASDYAIDAHAQNGLHMPAHVAGVAVELGKTTQVTVKLDPAAVISTTVLDRASRQPVPYACVNALTLYFQGIESGSCGTYPGQATNRVAESAADGTVRIGEIPAGTRYLFVEPPDSDHGIQWVGAHGGVGSQYDALKIDAVPGKVSELSPILLDPPGSLSGTFVDASGGPLETTSMCASVLPQPSSGLAPLTSCGGAGAFSIPGLGPYRWPVGFGDPWGSVYGKQWPGSARLDRKSAPTYKVTSGTTTDIGTKKIKKGHRLTGAIVQRDGQPWQGSAWVYAYDPNTGDYLGNSSTYGGDYVLSPLSVPAVKLQVYAEGYGTYWYRNSTTFTGADAVRLRPGQDTQLNIVVPQAR